MAETCYVIVDLTDEDEINVLPHSFMFKKDAKAYVRQEKWPEEDDWTGSEPLVYWHGDDVYDEEGRVLYMVRKVKLKSF